MTMIIICGVFIIHRSITASWISKCTLNITFLVHDPFGSVRYLLHIYIFIFINSPQASINDKTCSFYYKCCRLRKTGKLSHCRCTNHRQFTFLYAVYGTNQRLLHCLSGTLYISNRMSQYIRGSHNESQTKPPLEIEQGWVWLTAQ